MRLLLIVPALDLIVLIAVGARLGALPVVIECLATAALGLWLLRRQGRRLTRRAGRGVFVFESSDLGPAAAGILLILPGFLTDILGILVLIPPVRRYLVSHLPRGLAPRAPRRILEGEWRHEAEPHEELPDRSRHDRTP